MNNLVLLDGNKISGGINYITPECYSTEEREIGCWIDGKPLYQKTYALSSTINVPKETWTTVISDVSALNIEALVSAIGNPSESQSASFGAMITNNQLKVFFTFAWSINVITIQYTKTTDTAGSGMWTPSGIPTVHYSTEEQVIGTWVDGKTLYQKTYIKNNVGSSNEVVDANMTISNVTIVGIINNGVEMNSPYNGEVFKEYVSSAVVLRVFNSSSGLQCNLEGNHNYTGNVRFTVQYTKTS